MFEILTLFPELFTSFLQEGLISRAITKKLMAVNLCNFRQFGLGKHQSVDDEPYGGGAGMVLRVEPLAHAIRARAQFYQQRQQQVHKLLLSPQGIPFTQRKAYELRDKDCVLMLVCGRYEGFDERIRAEVDEEISGGDFVCLGGEVIAMMVVEVLSRLIPGVVGNPLSLQQESFAQDQLEYPQYTRPAVFEGKAVPDVLLSGNHQEIAAWRCQQALERTRKRRPDLL